MYPNSRSKLTIHRPAYKPAGKAAPQLSPRVNSVIKIVGLLLTLATIYFSARQFARAEKWKREEFLISQFNKFKENQYVQAAQHMLDYSDGTVLLNKDTLTFHDDVISHALENSTGNYTREEYMIREIFDRYFDELSLFNKYRTAGLLDTAEIKSYFKYYVAIIDGAGIGRKKESVRRMLKEYISAWQYEDVIQLAALYGCYIRTNGPKNTDPPVANARRPGPRHLFTKIFSDKSVRIRAND